MSRIASKSSVACAQQWSSEQDLFPSSMLYVRFIGNFTKAFLMHFCALQRISYLHHTTSVRAGVMARPQWLQLTASRGGSARPMHDAYLTEPEAPQGAYLAATLWNNDLPTKSPYPRDGEFGALYYLVAVPLHSMRLHEERFRLLLVKQSCFSEKTCLLCIVDREQFPVAYDWLLSRAGGTEVNKMNNDFFRFAMEAGQAQWYVLERGRRNMTWVNVFVVGDVAIGRNAVWHCQAHAGKIPRIRCARSSDHLSAPCRTVLTTVTASCGS